LNFETFKSLVNAINFGKSLPDALYIHQSALDEIPKELNSFILNIARALKISAADWDIVKIFKRDYKLSYLSYPDFLTYPYPSLNSSHTVDLEKKSSRVASYIESENPPILHRRELFLHKSNPRINEFYQFTEEGEALGLYQNTKIIGTLQGWQRAIKRSGHMLDENGHLIPLAITKSAESSPIDGDCIQRHKTAIYRDKLSVPMFMLARAGYLDGSYSVLDYGCGKGDDLRELEAQGISCIGWDPVYRPDIDIENCDVVNLGYVINVIEEVEERKETLAKAFELTDKLLAVSAMLGNEGLTEKFRPYKDGVITKANTFQKYYYQSELKEYIERSLNTEAIAAGPGLFFVFKDKLEEQQYLSERQRTRLNWRQISIRPRKITGPKVTKSKIEKNEALLKDFWYCCLDVGRLAANDEFEYSDQLRHLFGSHLKALDICQHYFSENDFARSKELRKQDLLVYLALDHFGKRQVYRRMPEALQRDIKYHFGKYQTARDNAKDLLFSVNNTDLIHKACLEAKANLPASHLTSDHNLVFQKDYLNLCPPALRVYVGCALQLYGDLDSIDLIKAHIQSGKVTLMVYEGYESEPIPKLKERIKIKLREQSIDFFDYVYGFRPQPLLNKSLLMPEDHANFEKQSKFDSDLLSILGEDILEEHVSAERLQTLMRENLVKIDGYKVSIRKERYEEQQ
jgi:DNA phosphorothioation-associated putative methyltransferase